MGNKILNLLLHKFHPWLSKEQEKHLSTIHWHLAAENQETPPPLPPSSSFYQSTTQSTTPRKN